MANEERARVSRAEETQGQRRRRQPGTLDRMDEQELTTCHACHGSRLNPTGAAALAASALT